MFPFLLRGAHKRNSLKIDAFPFSNRTRNRTRTAAEFAHFISTNYAGAGWSRASCELSRDRKTVRNHSNKLPNKSGVHNRSASKHCILLTNEKLPTLAFLGKFMPPTFETTMQEKRTLTRGHQKWQHEGSLYENKAHQHLQSNTPKDIDNQYLVNPCHT